MYPSPWHLQFVTHVLRKAIHNLEAKFTWKPPFVSEDERQEQDITLEDFDKAFELDQWFQEEQVAKQA